MKKAISSRIALAVAAALSVSQSLQAANTTFTTTSTSGNWSAGAWSTAITGIGAGDIAQFNTAATAATMTLDTAATLGQLQLGTAATSTWAISASGAIAFTLDGTGIISGNQMFGNAGEAAIGSRGAGANMTVNPNINFGTTALALGNTNTGSLTIGGSITASASQTLFFRGSGSGAVTVNGVISASSGSVAISNQRGSGGAVTISTALGSTISSITQGTLGGSAVSGMTLGTNNTSTGTVAVNAGTLTLSGTNTFSSYAVNGGTLNINNVGGIGSGTLSANGGATINAGVANITSFTTNNQALSFNGNVLFTSNSLNMGTGAVTLAGNNVGFILNTTNNFTLGGNIANGTSSSGVTSVTKTAQTGSAFTNMGALILNGTNTYTGGTIIQQGQVQFGSAASVPSSGSILLAGQGPNSVNYEGAAAVFNFALAQTQLGKISTASVGTAALSAASSNALDFSLATGANLANVSLGAQTSSTYSGTLTPWTSSNNGAFQLGGSGNQSAANNSILTVSSVLANSGSVSTGLIVDPTFVGFGAGTVSLIGANTYTGGTRVNTGTLKLDFSGAGAPTSNIISSSSALTLANFATLNITGKSATTNTQTFNGLTLLGSSSTISATQNGATSLTTNFGAISRVSNGAVTFSVLPTTGNFTTTNSLDGSSGGGILGTWATVGTGAATTYATKSGSNIASYTAGTTAATGAALTDTTGLVNYNLSAGGSLAGAVSLNTIRNTTAISSVDIGANNLTANGLLNSFAGNFTITSSSTGNIVIGANRELVVNSAAGAIFLSAPIVDNAAGASSVTYTSNGGGNFAVITKSNAYTGGTFINGNVAIEVATNAFGASTGLVTFNGGQLNAETVGSIVVANPLFFTQGTSSTINPNSQNITLTGAITGTGTMFVGDGGSFASLVLSGDMSGFGGTIIYNSGGGSGDNFQLGLTSAGNNNLSQATIIGENTNGTRRLNAGGGYLQMGSLEGLLTIIGGGTIQEGALNTNSSFGGNTNTNNVAIVKVGTGTWTLNAGGWGNNGGVTLNNGTLLVDMSTIGTPTNYLASAALTFNGGALSILGKATTLQNSSQAFSGTTINAGASTLKVDNNLGATGNTLATLAAITRTTTIGSVGGGTIDFVLPSGTQSATNGITTTSTGNVVGNVMVQNTANYITYATVNNGADWASLSSGNVIALAAGNYATNSLSGNADWTSNQGPAAGTASTMRFNVDNVTLTLTGANTVTGGGILTTANSASTGSFITGGTLTTGGGREFIFADYGKLSVASQLINNVGGSTLLTKSGTGLLTLTNTNNTYSGINYLNDGIVNIAAAASLGTNATAGAISFNGGTLQLASSFNLGTSQGINLGFKGGTFDTNGFASTYAGVIASSGAVQGTTSENTAGQFGFTKTGGGTLTLSGINTYAGATTITGGTLSISFLDNATTAGGVAPGANAGGIGKSANYAKNLVLNGGGLQYTGGAASTDRLFTLGNGSGTLDASGSGAINFTNTGAIGFQINSTGGSANSSPTLTLTGNLVAANTLAAVLGNNGLGTTSLTKTGSGTWVLTGGNTYTGISAINGGILNLGVAETAGVSGPLGNGGAITFSASGGTLQFSGANSFDYSSRLKNSTTAAMSFDTNSQAVAFASVIDSSNTAGFTKLGTGTLTLSNANTYTGTNTVGAGTLQVSGSGTLGSVNNDLTVNGGIVDLNNTSQGVGSLAGTGGTILNNGSATVKTLTIGNNNATGGSYAGVIANNTSGTGTVALSKTGSGFQTLTGTNTYTGATNVSNGTLRVTAIGSISTSSAITVGTTGVFQYDGTTATGNVTVNSGGTLKGLGYVGDVIVNSGGTLAPGDSPGIINTGNLTLATGTLAAEINGTTAGTNYDMVNVTGSVLLGGTVTVSLGYTPTNGDLVFLINNDGVDAVSGVLNGAAQGSVLNFSGQDFLIGYTGDFTGGGSFTGGNDVVLQAIPEPSTWGLIAASLGLFFVVNRRRENREG